MAVKSTTPAENSAFHAALVFNDVEDQNAPTGVPIRVLGKADGMIEGFHLP
jgi:hypothetical protein